MTTAGAVVFAGIRQVSGAGTQGRSLSHRQRLCPEGSLLGPQPSRQLRHAAGTEMLLWHWQYQTERKIYMFGIGTDFRKLKYPFVWYDILHVVDVLSRFPFVHDDPRFRQMVKTVTDQADEQGRYTAKSMFMAWKRLVLCQQETAITMADLSGSADSETTGLQHVISTNAVRRNHPVCELEGMSRFAST